AARKRRYLAGDLRPALRPVAAVLLVPEEGGVLPPRHLLEEGGGQRAAGVEIHASSQWRAAPLARRGRMRLCSWRSSICGLYRKGSSLSRAIRPRPQPSRCFPVTAHPVDEALGELPTWNLADLYPGPDAPALKADLDAAAGSARAFHERCAG